MQDVDRFFFFQAEDGIRDRNVTGVQTCALPISSGAPATARSSGSARRGRGRSRGDASTGARLDVDTGAGHGHNHGDGRTSEDAPMIQNLRRLLLVASGLLLLGPGVAVGAGVQARFDLSVPSGGP